MLIPPLEYKKSLIILDARNFPVIILVSQRDCIWASCVLNPHTLKVKL